MGRDHPPPGWRDGRAADEADVRVARAARAAVLDAQALAGAAKTAALTSPAPDTRAGPIRVITSPVCRPARAAGPPGTIELIRAPVPAEGAVIAQ